MGVYGTHAFLEQNFDDEDMKILDEALIYDEISRLPDERREEFLDSAESKAMEEAGVLRRNTLIRLSKNDDGKRRKNLISLNLARKNNDPLWIRLVKVRTQEKELLTKIKTKYGNKSDRMAKVSQRDYIKNRVPIKFLRK